MAGKITFEVTRGALTGQTFAYDEKTRIFVGRQEDCGIVLPENTVSRYHCVLEITPPEVKLQDFGSKNGTYLDGKLIGRREREQSWEDGKDGPHEAYILSNGSRLGLEKAASSAARSRRRRFVRRAARRCHRTLPATKPCRKTRNACMFIMTHRASASAKTAGSRRSRRGSRSALRNERPRRLP